MEVKATVSQAVRANKVLLSRILGAHLQARASAREPLELESYNLVALHRRQEAAEHVAATSSGTEKAVLELFA